MTFERWIIAALFALVVGLLFWHDHQVKVIIAGLRSSTAAEFAAVLRRPRTPKIQGTEKRTGSLT